MQEGTVMPAPPRLHWGLLLVIYICTCGLFVPVWTIVQSNWSRKIHGKSTAFTLALIYAAGMAMIAMMGFTKGIITAAGGDASLLAMVLGYTQFVTIILDIIWRFTMRSELQASPINIPLGGVMTFFFSSIYFQYHLHDYIAGSASGAENPISLNLSSDTPPAAL